MSEEGWQNELVDKFAAQVADGSLTHADTMAAMEEDAFLRDFVAAQTLSRRSRTDHLLQVNRQRAADASAEGPLTKQWLQIGTKTDAPSEEAVKNV